MSPAPESRVLQSYVNHEICTRSVDRIMHDNVDPNTLFR